jgi:hypothetical protein
MEPITAISTAIASIKTAMEIAQLFKTSDLKFAEAEFKLKIADIINALADAKISIAEFKEIINEKDSQISELKKKNEDKSSIQFYENYGIYIEKDNSGKIIGNFCTRCFDVETKKIRLNERDAGFSCFNCKAYYSKNNQK